MPPFVGTPAERRALAAYLASLGGTPVEELGHVDETPRDGAQFFGDNCSMCHGPDADFPFDAKGRDAKTFYEMLGRLPAISDAMPPFEGTDAERQAVADHLTTLGRPETGAVR
jgi:mono/diheme cytochrome c family protein